MTFLLSEDKALRDKLMGMTVTDQKSSTQQGPTRNVKVYFGQPDQEIRDQSYPYMTIDMVDIAEDFQRAMRGKVAPWYLDPTSNDSFTMYDGHSYTDHTSNWQIDMPIPVSIDYQITTYARQPRHDREILSQLLYTRLPLRFAVLETDDNTVRRLDVLDVAKRDVTENGKRLFVNAITVRVSSEISPQTYETAYKALTLYVTGVPQSQVVFGEPNFTSIDSYTQSAQ